MSRIALALILAVVAVFLALIIAHSGIKQAALPAFLGTMLLIVVTVFVAYFLRVLGTKFSR